MKAKIKFDDGRFVAFKRRFEIEATHQFAYHYDKKKPSTRDNDFGDFDYDKPRFNHQKYIYKFHWEIVRIINKYESQLWHIQSPEECVKFFVDMIEATETYSPDTRWKFNMYPKGLGKVDGDWGDVPEFLQAVLEANKEVLFDYLVGMRQTLSDARKVRHDGSQALKKALDNKYNN